MRWPDYPPDNVRCFSCGLLAQLDPQSELHEVGWTERDLPSVFWDDGIPHCAVGRMAPTTGFEGRFHATKDHRGSAIATIKQVRSCPDWMPYVLGLSLRDHLAERNVIQLEQERREWEKTQAAQTLESQKQVDRIFFRLAALQTFLAVIAIIITILVAWLFGGVTVIVR